MICSSFECPPTCNNKVKPEGDCCERCGNLLFVVIFIIQYLLFLSFDRKTGTSDKGCLWIAVALLQTIIVQPTHTNLFGTCGVSVKMWPAGII